MKTFLAIATFLLVASANGQVAYKEGTLISNTVPSRSSRAVATIAELCKTAETKSKKYCNGEVDGNQCDATAVILCTGTGIGTTINCGTSYCYNNGGLGTAECLPTKPKDCASKSDFQCLSAGIFPNPTDCTKYINCYDAGDKGFIPDEYQCDPLYYFDPSSPAAAYCRYSTSTSYCIQVDCSKFTSPKNVIMSYPTWSASKGEIVASCLGAGVTPLVTRCPAGFKADLTPIPADCKLVCTAAGTFEFIGDITKYYLCVRSATGAWTASPKDCFRGFSYNKVTKLCDIPYTAPTTVAP